MPHTKSRYMQDLAFSDARIRLAPSQELLAFGTATLTRTAAGNINFAQGASLTNQYTANMTSVLIRRTGFFEDLQEQFGGLGIPPSAEYQGRLIRWGPWPWANQSRRELRSRSRAISLTALM